MCKIAILWEYSCTCSNFIFYLCRKNAVNGLEYMHYLVIKLCGMPKNPRWQQKYQQKNYSGQSKAGNSNASGTGLVRVIAQGLSRSYSTLLPMKIPSIRLTSPGSPRMFKWLHHPFKKIFSHLITVCKQLIHSQTATLVCS